MALQARLQACDGTLENFIDAVLPGTSNGVAKLRLRARELCADPLARGALVLGPAGAGKSTLARAVALGRFVAVADKDAAKEFIRAIRLDAPGRIAETDLPWYCELGVTGLVASVAAAQLQGYARSVSGGERQSQRGVFERAARGGTASVEAGHPGVRLTRGVVFLDEIGDLDPTLQPLLLGAVTGAPLFRVGEEGFGEGFRFAGLTIAATWRAVDRESGFRHDLLQRLSDHVLHVPSLSERADEMPEIVDGMMDEIRARFIAELTELLAIPQANHKAIGTRRDRAMTRVVTASERDALLREDWSKRGELRGLSQTVRRLYSSEFTVDQILKEEVRVYQAPDREMGDLLLAALRGHPAVTDDEVTLKSIINDCEGGARRRAKECLQNDPELIRDLSKRLGIAEQRLRKQVSDLGR